MKYDNSGSCADTMVHVIDEKIMHAIPRTNLFILCSLCIRVFFFHE